MRHGTMLTSPYFPLPFDCHNQPLAAVLYTHATIYTVTLCYHLSQNPHDCRCRLFPSLCPSFNFRSCIVLHLICHTTLSPLLDPLFVFSVVIYVISSSHLISSLPPLSLLISRYLPNTSLSLISFSRHFLPSLVLPVCWTLISNPSRGICWSFARIKSDVHY